MLWFRRKSKGVDEKQLDKIIRQELGSYVSRRELKEAIAKIGEDEEKRKLWDSLPAHKKVKLLRYAIGKKGEKHGKK